MKIIDMHTDALMHQYYGQTLDAFESKGHLDVKRLQAGGHSLAQFFAVCLAPVPYMDMGKFIPNWNELNYTHESYIAYCVKAFNNTMKLHSDVIAQATNADEILANDAAGKLSGMLSMEDGAAVDGKLENIKRFYDMGFRAIGLTWNFPNCFGSGTSTDPEVMAKGLTDFGKEAVRYMQELGMLVDVSHLNDGGFWDVVAATDKPFVATHSNARAVCPHQRNMTDEMIRKLAERGGVMGLNFGPEFLAADVKNTKSTVALMVDMLRYEKNVGGVDVLGIGTDFDGIGGELEIDSCDKMGLLEDGLSKGGFTDDEIDKIFSKNVLRVLKDSVR